MGEVNLVVRTRWVVWITKAQIDDEVRTVTAIAQLKTYIPTGNARTQHDDTGFRVVGACRFNNPVYAIAPVKHVGVLAGAAIQGVITRAAGDNVISGQPGDKVVATQAADAVDGAGAEKKRWFACVAVVVAFGAVDVKALRQQVVKGERAAVGELQVVEELGGGGVGLARG